MNFLHFVNIFWYFMDQTTSKGNDYVISGLIKCVALVSGFLNVVA
jgi:hypothetical protein